MIMSRFMSKKRQFMNGLGEAERGQAMGQHLVDSGRKLQRPKERPPPLLTAPLVASLWRPLEFNRKESKSAVHAPENGGSALHGGRAHARFLVQFPYISLVSTHSLSCLFLGLCPAPIQSIFWILWGCTFSNPYLFPRLS